MAAGCSQDAPGQGGPPGPGMIAVEPGCLLGDLPDTPCRIRLRPDCGRIRLDGELIVHVPGADAYYGVSGVAYAIFALLEQAQDGLSPDDLVGRLAGGAALTAQELQHVHEGIRVLIGLGVAHAS